MARSRNIKPGLFKNDILGEADPNFTLLFAGLWTLADREGRLENRPKRIKAEIFPYRMVDVSKGLAWLMHESFINVYEIEGVQYIQINNWRKHQSPHHKEADSEIPEQPKQKKVKQKQDVAHTQAMHESCMDQASSKKNASSPLIPDSLNLIPDSLNSDSLEGTSKVQSSPAEPPDPPPPESPTVITLPTNRFNTGGEIFRVTEDMLPDWEQAYPAVDIRQELLKARAWLQDNPTKRKTVRGMRKFLGSWFSRQQDRGGSATTPPAAAPPKETAADRMRRDLENHERLIS